jgi:ElaA protein
MMVMPDHTLTRPHGHHALALKWQCSRLDGFSATQLYALLAAREAVFVVEQNCSYQEADGLDREAVHLVAWSGPEVAAYLRVLGPHTRFAEPSIGRVLTTLPFRGKGLGRAAMSRALAYAGSVYRGRNLRISAQTYLESFYASFGFRAVTEPYLEDDIPHIEMLRRG